jgi:hypothetical protein
LHAEPPIAPPPAYEAEQQVELAAFQEKDWLAEERDESPAPAPEPAAAADEAPPAATDEDERTVEFIAIAQAEAPAVAEAQTQIEQVRRAVIEDLLRFGRQALNEDRLLIPEDNNAHDYYQRVLALDPDNEGAINGIDSIVERYLLFAQRALQRHDEQKARLYIERGLRVRPDDRRLLDMRYRMNIWLSRLEDDAIGNAPVPPPPPMAAEPAPSRGFMSRMRTLFSEPQSAR